MKYLLLWLLVMFCPVPGNCRQQVGMSEQMPYNENAGHRLLLMTDGSTLLFTFEMPNKISVTVFDTLHHIVAANTGISHFANFGNPDPPKCCNLFELNGKAYLFMERTTGTAHLLVRQIYDPAKGSLQEETVIQRSDSGSNTCFSVMPAPTRDGYAVVLFRGISGCAPMATLTHYTAGGQVTNTIDLNFSEPKFVVAAQLSVDADSNSTIFMAVGLRSAYKSGGLGSYARAMLVAELSEYDTAFHIYPLPIANGSFPHYNQGFPFVTDFAADPVTGGFSYLMLDTHIGKNLVFYPKWLSVNKARTDFLFHAAGDSLSVQDNITKQSFHGIPVSIFRRGDTTTIVTIQFLEHTLGEIRIVSYDPSGTLLHQLRNKTRLSTENLYPDDIVHNHAFRYTMDYHPMELLTSVCIEDRSRHFLFYNEDVKRARTPVKGTSSISARCLQFGTNYALRKKHPFGAPAFNHFITAYTGATCYDPTRHVYASLTIENSWYKRFYRVAWVTLDQ